MLIKIVIAFIYMFSTFFQEMSFDHLLCSTVNIDIMKTKVHVMKIYERF